MHHSPAAPLSGKAGWPSGLDTVTRIWRRPLMSVRRAIPIHAPPGAARIPDTAHKGEAIFDFRHAVVHPVRSRSNRSTKNTCLCPWDSASDAHMCLGSRLVVAPTYSVRNKHFQDEQRSTLSAARFKCTMLEATCRRAATPDPEAVTCCAWRVCAYDRRHALEFNAGLCVRGWTCSHKRRRNGVFRGPALYQRITPRSLDARVV